MPRVMLVDDDHDTVYSFQVVLELNGYNVDGFTDPYLALRNFSEGLYDLIVVGVKMPNLSGFDLFSLLKRKDHNANISFVTAGEIKFYDRDSQSDRRLPTCVSLICPFLSFYS